MELIQMVAYATIAAGGASAIGIGIAIYNMITTKTQIDKQTKVNSAQFSLELIKRVRDPDFADVVDKIFDDKSDTCDKIILERFLNHFDMIAKFYEDDLVDIQHVTQIYGGLLRKIKNDQHIQTILNAKKELFGPLIRLYNKI